MYSTGRIFVLTMDTIFVATARQRPYANTQDTSYAATIVSAITTKVAMIQDYVKWQSKVIGVRDP